MATLKDAAKLACVDVSTVSRTLNNTSYVDPDTKARIFAAVKELSYQPNLLAKGLRQGKRNTIGVVIPRLIMTVFAEIPQGVGALRALKEQAQRPEQIRVIGLTGHIIGGTLETAMTSMEMPAHEIGVKVALMTLEKIDSPEEHKAGPRHLFYQSSLVEREIWFHEGVHLNEAPDKPAAWTCCVF